jgi:hypothetical protein
MRNLKKLMGVVSGLEMSYFVKTISGYEAAAFVGFYSCTGIRDIHATSSSKMSDEYLVMVKMSWINLCRE